MFVGVVIRVFSYILYSVTECSYVFLIRVNIILYFVFCDGMPVGFVIRVDILVYFVFCDGMDVGFLIRVGIPVSSVME